MPTNDKDFKQLLQQSIIWADIVKMFDYLLTVSVEAGASDIHIEPFENYARIRIRTDWELEELIQYPITLHDSVISKFKIESGQMRPDEKRLPQDARVSTMTQTNKEIDLRANTLPTIWWEKLCMRIVDKSKKSPELHELGIEWINDELIKKSISQPNWIIFTSGPTGSGKTNTLYAALAKINTIDVNITTFEDPVENKMFGLNQSQVRSDIWFTFAEWLRSALRQDPDIIMVWEIRDHETLEMAMEAAMTWHLVVSTIHTNSSAETITRVVNMWAKWFMIAWTFNLVIAQRLARKICSKCKTKTDIKSSPDYEYSKHCFAGMNPEFLKNEIIKRWINPQDWQDYMNNGISYEWSGKDPETWGVCPICAGSGYKWRIGIFELMYYDDVIKDMVIQGKTAMEIEKYALGNGMISLERDAVFKSIGGKIPLKQVYELVRRK